MAKTIKLKQANFIKYLFFYFIAMLICDAIKTNYLVNSLVKYGVDVALLSGHLSSITASIFVVLRLVLIVIMCILVRDLFFEETIQNNSIFEATKIILIIFILVEFIRVLLIYFVLFEEVESIDTSKDIIEQLNNTKWFYYNSLIYKLLTIYGSVLFGAYIYLLERKVIPAIIFGIVFFACFFFSNIDILT